MKANFEKVVCASEGNYSLLKPSSNNVISESESSNFFLAQY